MIKGLGDTNMQGFSSSSEINKHTKWIGIIPKLWAFRDDVVRDLPQPFIILGQYSGSVDARQMKKIKTKTKLFFFTLTVFLFFIFLIFYYFNLTNNS